MEEEAGPEVYSLYHFEALANSSGYKLQNDLLAEAMGGITAADIMVARGMIQWTIETQEGARYARNAGVVVGAGAAGYIALKKFGITRLFKTKIIEPLSAGFNKFLRDNAPELVPLRLAPGIKPPSKPYSLTSDWAVRPPTLRGKVLHPKLGENLQDGFETIDRWEPASGTVVSIKTRDLTTSTYLNESRLKSKVRQDLRKLADFDGASGKDLNGIPVVIDPGDTKIRILRIGVPQGTITTNQQTWFTQLAQEAQQMGITLEIREVP